MLARPGAGHARATSCDAEGNRTARWQSESTAETSLSSGDTDITVYTWDNRDRMTSATNYATYAEFEGSSPEQTVAYVYDAFDRLVAETVTNTPPTGQGQPSVTQTAYVYDGSQVVLQFDATYADTTVGYGLGVGDLSHRYLWAVDQLLADEQAPAGGWGWDYYGNHLTGSGTTNWPLTDNQGSIRDIAEYDAQTGVTSIVDHLAYNSFGKLTSQTNAAVDSAFGYAGGMTDWASGLQLNGKRWYDPGAATWLRQDPSGLGPDVNPYRYCGNSPTNGTDPSGEYDHADDSASIRRQCLADLQLIPNVPSNDRVGQTTGWEDADADEDGPSDYGVYDFDEVPCGRFITMGVGGGDNQQGWGAWAWGGLTDTLDTLWEGGWALATSSEARSAFADAWQKERVEPLGQRWYNISKNLGYTDAQIGDEQSLALTPAVFGDILVYNAAAEAIEGLDAGTGAKLGGAAGAALAGRGGPIHGPHRLGNGHGRRGGSQPRRRDVPAGSRPTGRGCARRRV